MNTPPLSRRLSPGFTLVELLTVIAIIAILMALLFPAIQTAKEAARRGQASNDVQQIVTAVKAYYTEYGRYPDITNTGTGTTGGGGGGGAGGAGAGGGAAAGDTLVGDSAAGIQNNNNLVFYTLRSMNLGPNTNPDYSLNPRRVPFFDGRVASSTTAPKAGFQPQGGAAATADCYFDPWGKQYCIVMDTNYDNMIDVSAQYTDFKDPNMPRVGVGAFSMGKDNILGDINFRNQYRSGSTKSDDVVSWQ